MRFGVPAFVLTALLAACSDTSALPKANLANVVDTLVIYAISGTDVYRPSGYAMTQRALVRLDNTSAADFGYDRTPDGRNVLLPGEMIGHPGAANQDPGLQLTEEPFDSITIALKDGYKTVDTVAVIPGSVLYVRSRIPTTCYYGYPAYGKIEVLGFDAATRTMQFRVLADLNCGYLGLEPGVPSH